MKCALIARDGSLVICEYRTPDCSEELRAELKRKLQETEFPLDKSKTKQGDSICIKNDVLIFACAASSSLKEEKLPIFLDELKDSFSLFYKIGLERVHQQTNLTSNILDIPFRKNFEKLFGKYNTGINMSAIQEANAKANVLKDNLSKAVKKQYESLEETKKFEDTAEVLDMNAKLFEKKTKELEEVTRKRNWWFFSTQCIATFAIGGAATVGLIIALIIII